MDMGTGVSPDLLVPICCDSDSTSGDARSEFDPDLPVPISGDSYGTTP